MFYFVQNSFVQLAVKYVICKASSGSSPLSNGKDKGIPDGRSLLFPSQIYLLATSFCFTLRLKQNTLRRIAISDIHGCLKTFYTLLLEIKFSKQDQLYLLGDYIDRGPDSKGVIDYIWQLQQAGYTIFCLRGNHEQMLLDEINKTNSWYNGEPMTLKSFGVDKNEDIPIKYIDWMRHLGYFLEVDDYILVHAGLNFKAENPLGDFHEMLWIRYFQKDIRRDWLGKRIIIHGHTPTTQSAVEKNLLTLEETSALCIDNGCSFLSAGLGHLIAFDMTNRSLYFQPRLDVV
jgi:serine/threonine protein phosphatase 1